MERKYEMSWKRTKSNLGILLPSVLFLCSSLLGKSVAPWIEKQAKVRALVSVSKEPDYPELGIYAEIPDGGLLPGPIPVPTVYDSKGNLLRSRIVGYHKEQGLGLIFEQPSDDIATIYVTGSKKAPALSPECKLIPSLFMYTKNRKEGLDEAKRMSQAYPPAPGAFFGRWKCFGSMVNPFGPDDHFSTWFTGCFALTKKETLYLATISDEGSEVAIDGKTVLSWPGIHTRAKGAKGEKGTSKTFEKGLHQVDYFHFEVTGRQEAQLACKRPGEETKSGLPELMMADLVFSGDSVISSIELQDGRACTTLSGLSTPVGYMWTGNLPLNIFSLSAMPVLEGKITLDFGSGQRIQLTGRDSSIDWFVPGDADMIAAPVTVEVANKAGIARSTMLLKCPWTPTQLSLDNPGDCLRVRSAIYNKAVSVDPPADPCKHWISDDWQILVEMLEPYRAGPILKEIFTRSWKSVQSRPQRERWALEDRWIETLRLMRKDDLLLEWINKFEKAERNGARKFRWKDERICAFLFDLNKPALAKREVARLKDAATSPDQIQLSYVRMGDFAHANGDMQAAANFYQEAEKRFADLKNKGVPAGRLSYVGPRMTPEEIEAKRILEEKKRNPNFKVEEERPKKKSRLKSLRSPKLPQKRIEDWKVKTVHNASMYTTITTYLSQDAIQEAIQELGDWGVQSPSSKLSGEYPMAAARVYIYVRDYRRAVNVLDIYCRQVEMSAQLADAMKLETECLAELKDWKRQKEVAEKFLRRFRGHPFEEYMKELKERH